MENHGSVCKHTTIATSLPENRADSASGNSADPQAVQMQTLCSLHAHAAFAFAGDLRLSYMDLGALSRQFVDCNFLEESWCPPWG